ncbi:MAG: hypothetical protein NZM37_00675, partial [Sandaracinaceae bacterium]|nr:hypothetical protein [Sandaracinaceae bacterium]
GAALTALFFFGILRHGGNMAPNRPGEAQSIDEEAMAMRRGQARMLWFGGALALAIVLGGGWLLIRSGPNEYSAIGRQVNGMRKEHFDAFWVCALPNGRPSEIHNNAELSDEIHKRAEFSPSRYAQLLRTQCLAHLQDHLAPIDALIPPEDLKGEIAQLKSATQALIEGWNTYLRHLQNLSGGYDREAKEAQEPVSAITRAWYDYRVAHGRINDIVRKHLED